MDIQLGEKHHSSGNSELQTFTDINEPTVRRLNPVQVAEKKGMMHSHPRDMFAHVQRKILHDIIIAIPVYICPIL